MDPSVPIASTIGTDTKFVPVIMTEVCELVMVSGDNEVTVGKLNVVMDPPRETEVPLIVMALLARSALEIVPEGKLKVTPLGKVIVSPESPSVNVVPNLGLSLSTFTSLIISLMLERCSFQLNSFRQMPCRL